MNSPISILFEDSHCLAIVKPPGQLTQGTPGRPPGELSWRPPFAVISIRPIPGRSTWGWSTDSTGRPRAS